MSRKRSRSRTARAERREQMSHALERQDTPDPLQMTFAFDTPAATPAPIVPKPKHVGSEICPDCGVELWPESRCFYCPNCGYSKCPNAAPQEDELKEGEAEV